MDLNTRCQERLEIHRNIGIPTDQFKFAEHVPPGMRPCFNCCHKGVDEWLPGHIHEWDGDEEFVFLQCCHVCAGTGVCLEASMYSDDEYDLLSEYKGARSKIRGRIAKLTAEYSFGLVLLLTDRLHETVEALDAALDGLESFNQLPAEEALAPFDMLSTLLGKGCTRQDLIAFLGERRGTREGLNVIRERLQDWWTSAKQILPAHGSAEERTMCEWLKPRVKAIEDECDRLATRYRAPILWEDLAGVLIMYDKWVRIGRPPGTYAETIVRETVAKIVPLMRTVVFASEELKQFVYQNIPPELAALTPQLLAELHAAAKQFGQPERGGARRCLKIQYGERSLTITASGDPGIRRLMVMGGDAVSMGDVRILKPQDGDMQQAVMWDRHVGAEDIRGMLNILDEEIATSSLEGVFGAQPPPNSLMKRVFLPSPEKNPDEALYRIEHMFAEPLTALTIFPGTIDAESFRQQFDYPDLLIVHTNPFGARSLCLRVSLPFFQRRDNVIRAVLEREGIATDQQISALSFEEIKRLRGLINEEIQAQRD